MKIDNNFKDIGIKLKKFSYSNLCNIVESFGANIVTFSIIDFIGDNKVLAPDITSDDIIINGKCQFFIDYWRVSENIKYSDEVINPTWKDIILIVDELLKGGDGCGVFFEGFKLKSKSENLKLFEISIGS